MFSSTLAWRARRTAFISCIISASQIQACGIFFANRSKDYRDFEAFFISWIEGVALTMGGKVINIDGKKLRGSVDKLLQQKSRSEGWKSAIHLVEAWCSELNLCLGQHKTEDKSNEITAIPALLDLLEISGSTVTIDAMGCQKTIAIKIIDKQADYILGFSIL